MIEENREFNNLFNTQKAENSFLANEIVEISQEKDLILKALSEAKSFLSFKEFELENKQKLEKELLESLEDTKSKNRDLEMMNSELIGKLNANKEEITNYKLKIENLNKQLKEENFRLQNEVEKLNNINDYKTKEENKKTQSFFQLENDLRVFKEKLENLTSSESLLQGRHKDLLIKYQKKKEKLSEKTEENDKLTQSLRIFEDKLKILESTSIRDINSLKNEKNYLNSYYLEELEKKEKEFNSRFEKLFNEATVNKEATTTKYEFEISNLKSELERLKTDFETSLNYKEDEIQILNEDRSKLHSALISLESKIIEISKNLESSVTDC